MASEQLSRRENTTNERDIRVEKDRVPKMTTHFEQLSVHENAPPHGTIDALQGGEINKDHAGKAIGDVDGGRGRARETHELGSHFEPIADKVKGQNVTDHRTTAANVVKGQNITPHHRTAADVVKGQNITDHRTAANVVGDKRSEDITKGREAFGGGARDVGKFQMQTEGGKSLGGESLDRGNMNRSEELERRTRVVEGTRTTPDIQASSILGLGKGAVVAEKGRVGAQTRGEREENLRGRVGAMGEEKKFSGRAGAEAMGEERVRGRVDAPEREGALWGKGGVQKERGGAEARGEEKFRGRVGVAENQGAMLGKGGVQKGREEEENKRATLEDISKYRNQAQETSMNAISAAQERYERAKQATNETLSGTTQTAQQKAAQAKDVTLEKGQQGYEATKDTVSNAAKTAAEYTAPAVEKAKSATGTTVSYVGEKAAKAKDVTLETGKTAVEIAGKVAADLKDKAMVAGWTAANYSTELTVEGTKAAANVVEGVAGYTGHKAAELAAKSVDVVKNLAASAGETAKVFTARKKEESWREYEAKRATQPQEGEAGQTEGIGETVRNYAQKVMPSGESNEGTNQEGRGSNVISAIGETVGNVGEKVKKPFENLTSGERNRGSAGEIQGNEGMTTNIGEKLSGAAQTMKKPLQNITEGGKEVMGAVTETVGNIGSNMMKPAEKVQEQRGISTQEGQSGGGGVLDAIGETIAEIAQTTKVIVVGEDDKESKQNIGLTSRLKHEHVQPPPRSV